MSNDTVVSSAAPARVSDPLTELLRTGARRLIKAAVSAQFEEYLSASGQKKLPEHTGCAADLQLDDRTHASSLALVRP